MNYDYSYVEYEKRKRIPVILQLLFLGIGALLIAAFAVLYSSEPKEADAGLFSPVPNKQESIKKDYEYKLVFADNKKLIYKETQGNSQTLKIVNTGTNISEDIAKGARIGFSGFISDSEFIFLEDNDGLSRFTVNKYNIIDKTTTPFLAFDGPDNLPLNDTDNLISISPSNDLLAINHRSGIVIYTIKTETEKTILENNPDVTYQQPKWISNSLLLIFQSALTTQTPIIVTSTGAIQTVFPSNLKDLSLSIKGLPLAAVSNEGLHTLEPKKTSLVLKNNDYTTYSKPVWSNDTIIVFANIGNLPTVIKTDKLGKKVITLKEFLTEVTLSDLQTDPLHETVYFMETSKSEQGVTVSFYKMGKEDNAPVSFYSISKNF